MPPGSYPTAEIGVSLIDPRSFLRTPEVVTGDMDRKRELIVFRHVIQALVGLRNVVSEMQLRPVGR